MKIIKGNKSLEMPTDSFKELCRDYDEVHLDIGTGDGRYPYKSSIKDLNTYFVGMDPSHTQLEIYSKRAQKDRIENVLFVLGSIELFPEEFEGCFDNVTIFMPWGSLLQSIVSPTEEVCGNLFRALKPGGELEMIFGYSQDAEPSEVIRLKLDRLNIEYIKENVIPHFLDVGFSSVTLAEMSKDDLREFDTTWSKRLSFGQDRPLFHLQFKK
jgi:16S rRNA (adenine(1408)-N(1))-methyltransferase